MEAKTQCYSRAVRTLVLSDIHANARAFEAVLKDATTRGFDRSIFLGDALGYGPHPVETMDMLRDLDTEVIIGNHDDWALRLLGGEPATSFGVAGYALSWQLEQLKPGHIAWLEEWPEQTELPFKLPQASSQSQANITPVQAPTKMESNKNTGSGASGTGVPGKGGKLSFSFGQPAVMPPPLEIPKKQEPQVGFLIHGSPREKFEYTDSIVVARTSFERWKGRLAFVGHTHIPAVYSTLEGPTGEWTKQNALRDDRSRLVFPPRGRWIANPGSVGQPRDGNPKASYGIYDDERHLFEVFRVEYDVAGTQRDIRAAGLPEPLALRLTIGK